MTSYLPANKPGSTLGGDSGNFVPRSPQRSRVVSAEEGSGGERERACPRERESERVLVLSEGREGGRERFCALLCEIDGIDGIILIAFVSRLPYYCRFERVQRWFVARYG